MRPVATIVLLTGFIGAGWCAETDPPDSQWLRLTSSNFDLYTTASEDSGLHLIRHFEQIRRVLQPALGWTGADRKPVAIIAFRSRAEFQPYSPTDGASGFFLSGADHDFIVMASASEENRTAAHEYGHVILSHTGWRLPAWLNEGLAELYSYSDFAGSDPQVAVGRFIPGRISTLRRGGWIGLKELLSVSRNSQLYSSRDLELFYAECWLLAHMLVLDPRYSPRFPDLISALRSSDAPAALPSVYGKPLAEVERDLRTYVADGHENRKLVDAGPQYTPRAIEVERSAGFGARLALAEMLGAYPGRTVQALGAYGQLGEDYPMRAEVEAGLAEIYQHEGDHELAAQHRLRADILAGARR